MSCINPLIDGIEKNPKFFYILGAFKGDGHYYKDKTAVQINVIDIDFLEEIKRIFNELSPKTRVKIIFQCKAHDNSKEQRRITFNCKLFFDRNYQFLEPQTKEEKIEYLKGLFDAEGCINYGYRKENDGYTKFRRVIMLAQKNIDDLIKWMKWIKEIGIKSRLIKTKTGRNYFYIKRTEDIKKFASIIGFRIMRKKEKLDFVLTKLTKSGVSIDKIDNIIKLYQDGKSSLEVARLFNLTKPSILRILRKNNIKRRSRLWKDKQLITSKIISIKSIGKQKGYDLETPIYNNFFLSNNILSHNSTLAYKIAQRVKSPFNPKNDIVFKRAKVLELLAKKKKGIIFSDELVNVAFNRDFYEQGQKQLIKGLNMYRDSCNLFLGCIPIFTTMDKQLQSLCKIRLTVVRRGIAIIQTQTHSIYTSDPWDVKNNQRIESEWAKYGSKPKYGKLTTFKGILKFSDLTQAQRDEYEAVKAEKRNIVFKEESNEIDEKTKSKYENILNLLVEGKIKDSNMLQNFFTVMGVKYATGRVKLNELLKDRNQKPIKYLLNPNLGAKTDKLGFKDSFMKLKGESTND